jgi:hypothetical protein
MLFRLLLAYNVLSIGLRLSVFVVDIIFCLSVGCILYWGN